jgi:hypothetical protein
MYEGHIYLFNPLKQSIDQNLQQRIPKTQILKKNMGHKVKD